MQWSLRYIVYTHFWTLIYSNENTFATTPAAVIPSPIPMETFRNTLVVFVSSLPSKRSLKIRGRTKLTVKELSIPMSDSKFPR